MMRDAFSAVNDVATMMSAGHLVAGSPTKAVNFALIAVGAAVAKDAFTTPRRHSSYDYKM